MKILITGGHLGPALAVIEELGKKVDLVFVGRKYENNKKNYSLEYQEISRKNIRFYDLKTARFTRLLNLNFILNIFKLPYGFYQAFAILLKEKPGAVLSFGSYLSFPICLAGFILGIPIFIHEQTAEPGLANRLSAFLAKKIFVSFPEAQQHFPTGKTVITGNPVKKTVLTVNKKPFTIRKERPVIYITGGSLGSQSINEKIDQILPQLLTKYLIIHQAGNSIKNNGSENNNYFLRQHFLSEELGYIYSATDLVIGRSGANTVFELIAWKKPSILIPLPWSANQEQLRHAQILQKAGVSEIFDQNKDPNELLKLIEKVLADIKQYKNNFKEVKLLYQENAAETITQKILSTLGK